MYLRSTLGHKKLFRFFLIQPHFGETNLVSNILINNGLKSFLDLCLIQALRSSKMRYIAHFPDMYPQKYLCLQTLIFIVETNTVIFSRNYHQTCNSVKICTSTLHQFDKFGKPSPILPKSYSLIFTGMPKRLLGSNFEDKNSRKRIMFQLLRNRKLNYVIRLDNHFKSYN